MLIRLVGIVSLEFDGYPARQLSSAQAQIAFARLVLDRASGTSRDQLADTIWPGGLPKTWASALRSIISRIRMFVSAGPDAPEVLVAHRGRYQLRLSDVTVDIEAAETAAAAASRALAGGRYPVAQQFATKAIAYLHDSFLREHEGEWADGVRERVDALRLTALETASLASTALGDAHLALRYADESVRTAPFRESAYQSRMAALAAAGNRAEALRTYHALRKVLVDELGIEPAPTIQAAYLELLRSPVGASAGPETVLPGQQLPAQLLT